MHGAKCTVQLGMGTHLHEHLHGRAGAAHLLKFQGVLQLLITCKAEQFS